ncbi:MAG: glycoside hydrolase family 3 protein [Spirochaetaceae bacterium]|nr:MAG: glycoside hydrolase family 3 protein [Spirochaetaceae bacterium]
MESAVLRRFLAAILFCFLCAAGGLYGETTATLPSFWDDRPNRELIESIVSEMNDQELLGQVFMLGYVGKRPSAEILSWIRARNLGGVKIFTRNVDTLAGLSSSIAEMQELTRSGRFQIPLFVSTDQEGGWVRHIKLETSQTPGNIALGASGLPQDALLTGYYIGQELRSLGINMNFAPTTDVYSNPSASVIGPRAFSSDPVTTATLALAYYRGMARSGIICTAKHFPGHGHADKDSHGTLPVVRISFEQMWERELVPYRVLIPEGIPAIMSAHIAYPDILGNLLPASRSDQLIEGVLRRKLSFQGVVITDDMEMNGAISGGVDTAQASLEALRAGNDMILVSHTQSAQERTWDMLIRQVSSSAEFKERIKTSVRRILELKLRFFKPIEAAAPGSPDDTGELIPSPGAWEFFQQSALRSVTLLRDAVIPLEQGRDRRMLLVGQFEEFLEEGRLRYPEADPLFFPYSPFYSAREEDLERVPRIASRYDVVVFCLANYNSLEVLETLRSFSGTLVVLSTLSPVYLRDTPWVQTALAVYGTGKESFRAGFAALAGDFEPEGRIPVDFIDGYPVDGASP